MVTIEAEVINESGAMAVPVLTLKNRNTNRKMQINFHENNRYYVSFWDGNIDEHFERPSWTDKDDDISSMPLLEQIVLFLGEEEVYVRIHDRMLQEDPYSIEIGDEGPPRFLSSEST